MKLTSTVKHVHKDVPGIPSGHELADAEDVAAAFGTALERAVRRSDRVDVFSEWAEHSVNDIEVSAFVRRAQRVFKDMSVDDIVRSWLVPRAQTLADSGVLYYVQIQIAELGSDLEADTFLKYEAAEYARAVDEAARALSRRAAERRRTHTTELREAPHTDFVATTKSFTLTVPDSVPLSVFFDKYQPSASVPVCVYGGLVKRLSTYTGPVPREMSGALVFVRSALYVYVAATAGSTVASYIVDKNEDEAEAERAVSELLRTVSHEPHVRDFVSVQGLAYFPGYCAEQYTFADFIMNNPTAALYAALGEFSVPSRPTGPVRIHSRETRATGVLSVKRVGENSSDAQYVSHVASPGDVYIRLFVARARSVEEATVFVARVAQLVDLYVREYPRLSKLYRHYIAGYSETAVRPGYTVPAPHDRDPEIFVPNYTRFCPHMPTRVDAVPAGVPAIEFPKASGARYICTDPVYKYPGVRENQLENADTYPYVPCCFKTPQTTKPKYRAYYDDDTEHRTQIRMITTDKVLGEGFFGMLPPAVDTLFRSIDPERLFIRFGVARDLASALDCLNYATGKTHSRTSLVLEANAALCMQDSPGSPVGDLAARAMDTRTYFDITRFYRLCEEAYGVDIYMFNRAGMVAPRSVHGHYAYKRRPRRAVVLYIQEPPGQCELVVSWKVQTNEYVPIHGVPVSETLAAAAQTLFRTWVAGVELFPIPVPEFVVDCTAQYVDTSGKVRGLVILDTFVACDPLPPLNVPWQPRPDASVDPRPVLDKYPRYFAGAGRVRLRPYTTEQVDFNARLARVRLATYVSDVFVYLYSVWRHRTGRAAVAEFVAEQVDRAPDVQYVRPGPDTALVDAVMPGGRFRADSPDLVLRLVYVLRLALARQPDRVRNMHLQKYFDNYYETIDDFRREPGFVVEHVLPAPAAQSCAEIHTRIPLGSDVFVIALGGTLWEARRAAAPGEPAQATVFVYNAADDVVRIPGGARTSLVYQHGGARHWFDLEKYEK